MLSSEDLQKLNQPAGSLDALEDMDAGDTGLLRRIRESDDDPTISAFQKGT